MVTIYDVAKQAKVSAMTVSRVINNTGKISDKTRAKVKRVMEELHYVPNSMARGLVLQETKILSLLITDITNPFYTTLARGAEDAAMKRGYKLLFSNSDEDVAKENEYVDMVLSTRVDGVLFAPAGDESLGHLEKLRKHGIPFVLIDREVPGIDSDMVLGDSKEGAKKLVEKLIAFGHKRIAMINGSLSISTARHRFTGYKEALKLNDIAFDEAIVCEAGYSRTGDSRTSAAIDRLLALGQRPTAIFAANNFLAIEAIRALRDRGVQVPEQISVVCFDDLELASVIDPFLTVAAQPAYQFGTIGVQLLLERISASSQDVTDYRTIILPSELVIRKSAAALT